MRLELSRRLRPVLGLPVLVLAACGGGGGSPTPSVPASGTASPSAAATSAAPTPSPTPSGPTLLVWAVGTGGTGAAEVRTVPIGGGTAHVVASLPSGVIVLGSGFGRLAVAWPDHTIHVIDLAGGAVDVYTPTGSPSMLFGAAFSPDGHRLAYVAATATPPGGTLQTVDLVTKATTTLRTFSGTTYDVPTRWNSDAMIGTAVVGFSDAGPVALVRLDPSTGARLATSDITGSGGVAVSADGLHAAVSKHNHLGDDGDSPGGPGPEQPFNTLRNATIGSPPADVFQEPHHQVVPLAVSASGDTICYSDDSAAGAFAGITLSNNFGLFLRNGSTTTQLSHWDGSRWDRGVFVGSAIALANHTSTAEKLMLVSAGGAPSTLDTVSGGDEPISLGLA
jgi:hypothetical protein